MGAQAADDEPLVACKDRPVFTLYRRGAVPFADYRTGGRCGEFSLMPHDREDRHDHRYGHRPKPLRII